MSVKLSCIEIGLNSTQMNSTHNRDYRLNLSQTCSNAYIFLLGLNQFSYELGSDKFININFDALTKQLLLIVDKNLWYSYLSQFYMG